MSIRRLCLTFVCTLNLLTGAIIICLPATQPVHAVDCSADSGLIPNPECHGQVSQKQANSDIGTSINTVATRILNIVYVVLGGGAAIILIYAGIQYMLTTTQPDANKKARQSITNVVLGIVLLSASYAIIQLAIQVALYFVPGTQ